MRVVFPNQMSGRFLDDLASEMNTFVESIFGEDAAPGKGAVKGFSPRMDVAETEAAYLVNIDLPGVNPDDVNIEMEDDEVVVHGSRQRRPTDAATEHRRVERSFGDFRRVIKLPNLVDKDAITASYDNGVLSITLPKMVETKTSRRIEISRGGHTNDTNQGS